MLKYMVYAVLRSRTSLLMQTPHGIFGTSTFYWSMLIVCPFRTPNGKHSVHHQASFLFAPSCDRKRFPFCLWAEDHCSAASMHTRLGAWFLVMNHETVETEVVLQLCFPSSPALLLGQSCCTVQWTCEINPWEKLDQSFKPFHFPDLLYCSTIARAVLAGSGEEHRRQQQEPLQPSLQLKYS